MMVVSLDRSFVLNSCNSQCDQFYCLSYLQTSVYSSKEFVTLVYLCLYLVLLLEQLLHLGDSLSVENLSLTINNDQCDQIDGAVPAALIVRDLQHSSRNSVRQKSRISRPKRAHLENELAHLDESTQTIRERSHDTPKAANHEESTARDSRDASDPKLEPDMPLKTHEEVDGAASIYTPEQNVPWNVDGCRVGILPRIYRFILTLTFGSTILSGPLGMLLFIIYMLVGAKVETGGQLVGLPGAMIRFVFNAMNFITGVANLSLILGICAIFLKRNQIQKRIFWIAITFGPVLVGLSIWLYYVLVLNEIGAFYAWGAGSMPQSFRGCGPGVEPQQSMLFEEATYSTQFARLIIVDADGHTTHPDFNMKLSRSIQTDKTLCAHGFDGNADLYGMGIRTGIYLQWMTCLLANNLLPERRKELQKVCLVFSLAVCIATIISSVAVTCVFSIDVVVLC